MPKFKIEVAGDKMTNVTLHSSDRVPASIPGAKIPGGKILDRSPGDYVVLCTTQFGTPGATVTCTISGANDSKRECTDTINDQGKSVLPCDFRLKPNGEVQ